jgi:hypothetical protein
VLVGLDVMWFALYAAAVVAASRTSPWWDVFNLNGEMNPPAWYSASQLLLVGLAFLFVASRLVTSEPVVAQLRPLWLVLGLGFTFLSCDEGAVVHERITHVLARAGFTANVHGGGQWVFFYLLLAAIGAVVFRKYLLTAWRLWRVELLLVIGGLALSFAGGVILEGAVWVLRPQGTALLLEIGAEELLEMAGVSLAAYAAFRVLSAAMVAEAR